MVELSGKIQRDKKYYGQTIHSKYKIEMAELSGEREKKRDTTARHSNQNNQDGGAVDSP